MEEHEEHLKWILERQCSHELRCSLGKCYFARSTLDYLGYIIIEGETLAQDKHVKSIQEFKRPTSLRQLRAFLGTAEWLREFTPNYSA